MKPRKLTNFETMLFADELKKKLMNIAMSKTLYNRFDAEDLLQTTYYSALKNQDQFDGEILDPWIVRILQNAFIDSTRKGKFSVNVVSRDANDQPIRDSKNKPVMEKKRVKAEFLAGDDTYEASTHDRSLDVMAERDLAKCMQELNETERDVVAMQQTMSYKEIEAVLNIKAASLRVKLCRAKEKLMICMGVSND